MHSQAFIAREETLSGSLCTGGDPRTARRQVYWFLQKAVTSTTEPLSGIVQNSLLQINCRQGYELFEVLTCSWSQVLSIDCNTDDVYFFVQHRRIERISTTMCRINTKPDGSSYRLLETTRDDLAAGARHSMEVLLNTIELTSLDRLCNTAVIEYDVCAVRSFYDAGEVSGLPSCLRES